MTVPMMCHIVAAVAAVDLVDHVVVAAAAAAAAVVVHLVKILPWV